MNKKKALWSNTLVILTFLAWQATMSAIIYKGIAGKTKRKDLAVGKVDEVEVPHQVMGLRVG